MEQEKKNYSDYKGPFARHLDKCGLNICGTNERSWKKTKEKFLKKWNHNTRSKKKVLKEVSDILLKYKVEYKTQEYLMVNETSWLDFNNREFSDLQYFSFGLI